MQRRLDEERRGHRENAVSIVVGNSGRRSAAPRCRPPKREQAMGDLG